MKKRVLFLFFIFLAFMGVCTVISKGIYRAGLARVTLCHPERKSMAYKISAAGAVLPGQAAGVYAEEGLRVGAVFVQSGDRVEAGTALFAVDQEDLAERLLALELQKAYLEAQLQDINVDKAEAGRKSKLAAERLAADYDNLVKAQDLQIRDCQLAADAAYLRLRGAEEERQKGAESVSGSDITIGGQVSDTEIALLRVEYEKALNVLEEAKRQKDEAIRSWGRDLEDAKASGVNLLAQTVQLKGELKLAEEEIGRLQELEQRQGVICADADGMVLEVRVETGERTADGASILYAMLEEGGQVQAALDEEEGSLLSLGDTVDLQYKTAAGEKKKSSGVIVYMERENGQRILRIQPKESGMLPGQSVQMGMNVKGDSYECVLPVGALHRKEQYGYYVYVAEETEGILGVETRLRKVPVTLLEQDGSYAAVECAALNAESDVVADSDKELQEGDAVRVLSE